MKTTMLCGLAVLAAGLLAPSTATAGHGLDIGVRVGVGWGHRHGDFHAVFHRGRHFHRHVPRTCAPVVHRHHWVRSYEKVWVPPAYRTAFCGYDAYGHPVYRRVLIRAGYYRSVWAGSRCACGAVRGAGL